MPKDLLRRHGKLRAVKTLGEFVYEPSVPFCFIKTYS